MKKKKFDEMFMDALKHAEKLVEATEGKCLNPEVIQNKLLEALQKQDFNRLLYAIAVNEILLCSTQALARDLEVMAYADEKVAH